MHGQARTFTAYYDRIEIVLSIFIVVFHLVYVHQEIVDTGGTLQLFVIIVPCYGIFLQA